VRDVIAYLARALVDDPDRVTVEELRGARGVTYEVRAAPEGRRVEVEVLAEGE
jgi:predicted RNA-binding protein YlqC (UPF0109 family)